MRLSTLASLAGSGQLRATQAAMGLAEPFYRVHWLAVAGAEGLLALLGAGPRTLGEVAAHLGVDGEPDALEAWLQVAVDQGDLSVQEGRYALRSVLARRLALAEHDAVLAMVEEMADLHARLLRETPARLRQGHPFTLEDQHGAVVARSSRIVEPFIHDAVRAFVPARGEPSLLEIGCGTGTHLRQAAACNAGLRALGLELQPEVAALARRNLEAWGLAERIGVEEGDVRGRRPDAAWDFVTLHQNIYYFPVAERVALLGHARGFLRPGGRLLLTTGCRGGGAVMSVLDLWGAATAGAGRLPFTQELVQQLEEAGFNGVTARRLVPGETLFAFEGTRA